MAKDIEVKREGIYKKYFEKFGKDPFIIGMFWNKPEKLKLEIEKSIDNNTEYNEYESLQNDLKKLYDNGNLFF